MKMHINLKMIALLFCIAGVSISALTLNHIAQNKPNDPIKTIWLKLWEVDGRVINMKFQVSDIGTSHNDGAASASLSTYPFQFDISDLGDISADDVRGIVNGYEITSSGRPSNPLLIRWWIVKKGQLDPNDMIPPKYPLTLKLKIRDCNGNEFNPKKQQATLLKRNRIIEIAEICKQALG
ncbi:MAG: hypothetical protein JRF71_09455 [Deltaproteobacteria bacterium]|nr:hypothetical protein [Deltaproteobacteria bacterium]MBW2201048.1 hypothetical protein [Deltaproteobacteria bacterium]MBW2539352.1 hypothetical protein [Deltaproteobacteria bacterium]